MWGKFVDAGIFCTYVLTLIHITKGYIDVMHRNIETQIKVMSVLLSYLEEKTLNRLLIFNTKNLRYQTCVEVAFDTYISYRDRKLQMRTEFYDDQ